MIPKEINLKDHKFESKYFVTGHFEFKIEVKYPDDSESIIFRRYSEIRTLYKSLLFKCPGCLIPDIPPKTVWLNIKYGNQDQISDRLEGIKQFFNHIIHHPILSKNKDVINFFSKNFVRKNSVQNNNIKNNNNGDSDDEFSIPGFNESKISKNVSEEDDEEDIKPLKEYIEEINNRNKGIMSKSKKIIGSVYNYYLSWTKNPENKEEENEDKNSGSGDLSYIKLSEENYDFIKKNKKNLGENNEINNYKEKISRLNEGVKSIIKNYEELETFYEKNTHALEKIGFINSDIQKYSTIDKNKNSNVDKFDIEEDENEKDDNIKKIKDYCTFQRGFLNTKLKDSLINIKNYQILLEGLLAIFYRKKDNINFLGKLHSQKCEAEKINKEGKIIDPLVQEKTKNLEIKINHQIKFIKKLNKDLEYEIKNFKENQENNIYDYINEFYENKYNLTQKCLNVLNRIKNEEDRKENISENNQSNIMINENYIEDENNINNDNGVDDF